FLNPILVVGNGRPFRVLVVVPFEEEDESPFIGLLKVEAGVGSRRRARGRRCGVWSARAMTTPRRRAPGTADDPPDRLRIRGRACTGRAELPASPGGIGLSRAHGRGRSPGRVF